MEFNDVLHTFFAESRGLLGEMESALMSLEHEPGDAEAIHAVFRAAHTIKGSAGLFGLDDIVGFTHHVETLLDRVRSGSLNLQGDMVGLLLQCGDHIHRLIDVAGDAAGERDDGLPMLGQTLVERLRALAPLDTAASPTCATDPMAQASTRDDQDLWHLSLRFSTGLFQEGFDPAPFIHHLRTLGRVVHISTLSTQLPALETMDPESCYLGFEIRLASAANKLEIESVFEFVSQDCELRILPPDSRVDDYLRLIEALPADRLRLGEILQACGALTAHELSRALAEQQAEPDAERAPLGEILVEERAVQAELVQGAIGRQNELRQRQSQEAKMIRVHSDKLDALINRVAELIIASASVSVHATRNQDRALREAVSVMSRLTEDVRDGAMRLRMVEIGDTFNRFRRVVRDVSKDLGKEIELHIHGGDTELDKSMVDRLGDPLTHLMRNAMDHGLEAPMDRLAAGKPAAGRLELRARHEAGGIVIEVADDGAGLNRERILTKARKKGLLSSEAHLSDAEVWALIFEPGFSTAEQISKLSGRGVGMDVVRRSIEALRGTLDIESVAGRGTLFRIRLPLTLAIIDGFLMAVGEAHYVVPLDAVLECVQLGTEAQDYMNLRGEVLPLLRLRRHFGLPGRATRRENVVVVQIGTRKTGLVVDQLKGEFQAVIKPLGPLMEGLPGISGSTILGSGEVALMLDIPALVNQASWSASQEARSVFSTH